ncbi:MAG: DUF4114 domain-containing protein, partial [Kofleriaceae bacterium]|nr:DUF4114 domain-containing protein [Kofleriaceae bacterium]
MSISPTWATVTQVDGTIIPESGIVQSELDSQGETLDAVADAAEFPEVFLPNTTGLVVFRDFAEFAGFENSIGWYNIGDDIVSSNGRAANLHPILGCGVPMLDHAFDPNNLDTGHHHGNPAMYVQDAEPTVDVSVDFAAEAVAGRYNGGFIAFYIITPEGNPSSDNCGDFIDDGGENSRIGRIYYTQKDLNDDGDFVHHLVYTSSVQSDRFYFAFEDLFRGGDNDFSDMMLRVDGLTPPCIPNAEICDGLDNDCDGLIDELDPDLLGVGDSCQCDGISLTCADGPTFGICQDGATVCNSGVIECTSTTGPSSEICDGLDNDCNNSIDDSPAGIGIACDGPDADLCPEGLTICQNGGLGCSDNTGPNEELCDGIDNDCDTLVDENPTDVGASCGSSIGSCSPGVEICSAGALDCDGETGPSAELCNGLDDNCNGVTDDSPTDIGASCGVTDVGPCDFGTTICVGGAPACAGEVGPQPETCNLVDDDCNNVVDDNPIDVGSPCGTDTGVCEPGTIECTVSGPACVGGVSGGGELCNGLDDDCNGLVDDNPPGVDDACGNGVGVCEPGLTKCINGAFQCVGGFSGTTETCNGEDDNCDGMIDEGDLCGGGACINGECTSPCDGGEFSCPVGQACIDDYCVSDACFGIICPNEQDGAQNVCDEGVCVAICDTVTCQEGVICRPTDGACVPNTCTFLPLCSDGELCKQDECVVDLCFEVECASDEFCRAGDCIGSCGGIDCETGQNCIDGSCQETGCAENCSGGFVCDAGSGECVANPCQGVNCGRALVCDTTNGECVDDPCLGVVCPSETECSVGNCFDIEEVGGDAGPEPQYVTPGGGGGCSTTGGQESGPWLLLVLAFALWAYRRRLYRRALHLLPSLLLGVFLVQGSACSNSGYCINCDENGNPIGGDGGVQLDASIDAGADASPACADGVIRMEVCDEIDNDCDGRIDEDFNLNSD